MRLSLEHKTYQPSWVKPFGIDCNGENPFVWEKTRIR
ncbi:hypothetical protein SAMN06296427_10937 [Moheibacter sediminis]|uniref:Uncharacterized protein n=1 Tax=Moheibacter sediminis TaxID=1434700 RepID=A0A1W2C7T0_9FLAO|nr:hypothetical protein SAMN06296427_10937 [Moheibacter sediminis]